MRRRPNGPSKQITISLSPSAYDWLTVEHQRRNEAKAVIVERLIDEERNRRATNVG